VPSSEGQKADRVDEPPLYIHDSLGRPGYGYTPDGGLPLSQSTEDMEVPTEVKKVSTGAQEVVATVKASTGVQYVMATVKEIKRSIQDKILVSWSLFFYAYPVRNCFPEPFPVVGNRMSGICTLVWDRILVLKT
jgi:hypothetical protein